MKIFKSRSFTVAAVIVLSTFSLGTSGTLAISPDFIGQVYPVSKDGTVSGWAFNRANISERVKLAMVIDDRAINKEPTALHKRIGVTPSNATDLDEPSKKGHSFKFWLPRGLFDGHWHELNVFAVDQSDPTVSRLIPGSPVRFKFGLEQPATVGTAEISANGITIRTEARFAGAVSSLVFGGKEFVNIADHGRQIQTAWQINDTGECMNPTEAGSGYDESSFSTSSRLLKIDKTADSIQTLVHPAYWLGPGSSGYLCDFKENPTHPGIPWQTGIAGNLDRASRATLEKIVRIGYHNLPNVIEYVSRITLDPEDLAEVPLRYMILQNPAAHLNGFLRSSFFYDPRSDNIMPGRPGPILLPVIASSSDEKFAFGVYSDEVPFRGFIGHVQSRFLAYGIENVERAGIVVLKVRTAKLPPLGEQFFLPGLAGVYRSFLIVGSLDEVRQSMRRLYLLHPMPDGPVIISR